MLASLKDLLDALLPPPAAGEPDAAQHRVQLATAVLLVETMRAEPQIEAAERQAVLAALRERFGLSAGENERLMALALETARSATDTFQFTSAVNEHFTLEQKIAVIEAMWRVAYADGTLGAHENHLMRKVGDLLHVPHGAYVAAKMRAREAPPAA